MTSNVKNLLQEYYEESYVKSCLFSDLDKFDLYNSPISLNSFLYNLDVIINDNYEFEYLGFNERSRTYKILSDILFQSIEEKKVQNIELCNSLIRTLNKSGSTNSDDYIKSVILTTTPIPKHYSYQFSNKTFDFDSFKNYFHFSSVLSKFLLKNDIENSDKEILELVCNQFLFHSVCEISNRYPEVIQDDDVFTNISSLLYANKKLGPIKKDLLHRTENHKTFKKVKNIFIG